MRASRERFSIFVIAGLDPAIYWARSLAESCPFASLAARQHGPPGQARWDERIGGWPIAKAQRQRPPHPDLVPARGELECECVARIILRFVIASVSEAIQGGLRGVWIASSLSLLAMTRLEREQV